LVAPIKKIMNQPQGMLLVCGPTGSGKTTTLYGILSEIVKKKINVVTLEDPIEYVLAGANQVQVNEKAGLTFAASLRSVLRQDPNVVFLGEIRDGETAEIALRASMTGHLVLSTLHTNDAIATVTRLLDLKIEAYLLASSLSGILAQRLVRTICPHCREEHVPDAAHGQGAVGEDDVEIGLHANFGQTRDHLPAGTATDDRVAALEHAGVAERLEMSSLGVKDAPSSVERGRDRSAQRRFLTFDARAEQGEAGSHELGRQAGRLLPELGVAACDAVADQLGQAARPQV
jgi:type II secretory ATPase GspE/PulE/Tfp pilus assembly ATPase PilB-like protein